MALTGGHPLTSGDKERTLTLMVAPVLAFVLVITGGVGAGFAAISEPEPAQPALSQASEAPEQSSLETPAPEELAVEESAAEEPAVIDPYDQAIALWGEPDFAAILSESFPDAEWLLSGNSYASLNWFGPGPKPTEAKLRTLWITVGKVLADRHVAAQEEHAQQQEEPEFPPPPPPTGCDWPPCQHHGETPTLQNCHTLPSVPEDLGLNGGRVQTYNHPTDEFGFHPNNRFEEVVTGMGLSEFSCRVAEAHGWWGGQYGMGSGWMGGNVYSWHSSWVKEDIVRSLLSSYGAILTPPSPSPPESESESESDEESGPDPETEP